MDIARPRTGAKRYLRVVAAAAAVVLLGAITLALSRLERAAPAVERSALLIGTVRRGEMLRQVRGSGTLVAEEIRWLPAATEGRVERFTKKFGAQTSEQRRTAAKAAKATKVAATKRTRKAPTT